MRLTSDRRPVFRLKHESVLLARDRGLPLCEVFALESGKQDVARALRVERLARAVEAGTVKAAQAVPDPMTAEHTRIRDEAQARYQRAVTRSVAVLEAEALAEARRKEESEARKKKRREEEAEALAAAFLLVAAAIYLTASRKLHSALARLTAGATPAVPAPTTATGTPPGAAPSVPQGVPAHTGGGADLAAEAEAFARSRLKYLAPFWGWVRERLGKERQDGEAAGEGEDAVARRLLRTAENIEQGRGAVVAATEAQATYGAAQLRLLERAGFETKVWQTMEDERVRTSHVLCGEQGEVPLGRPFQNGLMYPGDPNGGPEEVINCRCWLVGGRRAPGSGHLEEKFK